MNEQDRLAVIGELGSAIVRLSKPQLSMNDLALALSNLQSALVALGLDEIRADENARAAVKRMFE
jgi:hypothetical protein